MKRTENKWRLVSRLAMGAAAAPILALTHAAFAQEAPAGGGGDPGGGQGDKTQRVEVNALRLSDMEMRRKSSVAKQIYGQEEIEKYGDTNLSDVLQRLPGVDVQGGVPRLRGLGAGYTQLLINGDPAPNGAGAGAGVVALALEKPVSGQKCSGSGEV